MSAPAAPNDATNAGLAAGRQGREAAEARSAAQIVKLADNNAALARMNNRLTRQLEDLRAEHDQILHLSTGRLAVARAKEGELLAEVGGLKRLLRDSMVERQGLRAQLHAKQEVVRYLEWRLGQAQRLLEQQAAGACSPSPRNPLAAAFAAAAKAADGAPPDDSFRVLTDESGSTQGSTSGLYRTVQAMAHRGAISIPAASWAGSGAQSDKENAVERTPARPAAPADQRQALGPLQRGEAGDAAHANVTLRTPRAALAALPDPAPAAESPQAAAATPHEGGGGAQDEAAAEAPPAPPASSSSPPLQRVVEEAAQEPQAEDEGGEDSATRLVLETPARPRLPADGASAGGDPSDTPPTTLRSSSRVRRRVSYVLPSSRTKLRQGDAFTFGDASSFKKTFKKSGARTKPRARHSLGGGGGGGRARGAAGGERSDDGE